VIKKFVNRFINGKDDLRKRYVDAIPAGYDDIIKDVIKMVSDDEDDHTPDSERIHEIDDGDYQGTLIFVIGEKGYQPSAYWVVSMSYGSCSVCDTFQSIVDDNDKEDRADDLVSLALHVVQSLKEV